MFDFPKSPVDAELLLRSLQAESGLFSPNEDEAVDLQATLSGIKLLRAYRLSVSFPDEIQSTIISTWNTKQGCFESKSRQASPVFTNALSLLILHNIGAEKDVANYAPTVLDFIAKTAESSAEHFIHIAVADELSLSTDLRASIDYFESLFQSDGTYGAPLETAIASSSLLRASRPLGDKKAVEEQLKDAFNHKSGSFSQDGEPSLWLGYCAMRAIRLFDSNWTHPALVQNIQSQNALDINLWYQCASIFEWTVEPLKQSLRDDSVTAFSSWSTSGGNLNLDFLNGMSLLMSAAAAGADKCVSYLCTHLPADQITKRHPRADGDALFFAGQSGSLSAIKSLLEPVPEAVFDISTVNGHHLLLQLAFYGSEVHFKSTRWLLEDWPFLQINDGYIQQLFTRTNVRGYNATNMSRLWGNQEMADYFEKIDLTSEGERQDYLNKLIERLWQSEEPGTESRNSPLYQVMLDIQNYFDHNESNNTLMSIDQLIERIDDLLRRSSVDLNLQYGPLGQTLIIAAVTGVDRTKDRKNDRIKLVEHLLEIGCDPDLPERHPMAVDAIIRAAVLNQFEILQLLGTHMPPLAFREAMNDIPSINGQTALQDSIHRALTSDESNKTKHLDQIKWMLARGADPDIEDLTGKSPRLLALRALKDEVFAKRAPEVLNLLNNVSYE